MFCNNWQLQFFSTTDLPFDSTNLKHNMYKTQGTNKFWLFKKIDNKHRRSQFENWNFSVVVTKMLKTSSEA